MEKWENELKRLWNITISASSSSNSSSLGSCMRPDSSSRVHRDFMLFQGDFAGKRLFAGLTNHGHSADAWRLRVGRHLIGRATRGRGRNGRRAVDSWVDNVRLTGGFRRNYGKIYRTFFLERKRKKAKFLHQTSGGIVFLRKIFQQIGNVRWNCVIVMIRLLDQSLHDYHPFRRFFLGWSFAHQMAENLIVKRKKMKFLCQKMKFLCQKKPIFVPKNEISKYGHERYERLKNVCFAYRFFRKSHAKSIMQLCEFSQVLCH